MTDMAVKSYEVNSEFIFSRQILSVFPANFTHKPTWLYGTIKVLVLDLEDVIRPEYKC